MDIPDSDFLDAGSISQEEFDTFSSLLGETTSGASLPAPPVNVDPNHGNHPLNQQDHQSSSGTNQENVFPFHQTNPQNHQFDLFQHPNDVEDSDDFPF